MSPKEKRQTVYRYLRQKGLPVQEAWMGALLSGVNRIAVDPLILAESVFRMLYPDVLQDFVRASKRVRKEEEAS